LSVIEPGALVSHYRIDGELGRGAMASVYRATDVNGERVVALKTPHWDDARGPATVRRFLREVRLAMRLLHPNIVPVLGGFEHGGLPWLVMQLVEGPSLGEMIDLQGPLSFADVVRHGEGLASALSLAHSRGILHQDVSPNNILIAPDGRAKLLDFGLASISPPTPMTLQSRRERVVGTPGYMAPEKILGHLPDARADVFSLGAVLYEMATGRPAFPGSNKDEILDAILERDPAEMAACGALEPIVKQALAKLPEERHQSAEELASQLRRLMAAVS
jgi:serine/threonine-protein kinase